MSSYSTPLIIAAPLITSLKRSTTVSRYSLEKERSENLPTAFAGTTFVEVR
ncbi:hypothetical protein [uncultured Fusobacterium sp.]|uniref:hypothetical protein n=1 Tax=uncultured Fusobacterium sp. TaxID=159267 RepID=UPI0025E4078F|nr:hypothetical protein [uncultured Fusobacterium sp.]